MARPVTRVFKTAGYSKADAGRGPSVASLLPAHDHVDAATESAAVLVHILAHVQGREGLLQLCDGLVDSAHVEPTVAVDELVRVV